MVFTRSALSSGSTNVYTTPVASKSTSSKKTSPCVHAVNERSTRKPRVCYRKFFEDDEEEVVSHNEARSSFSTPPAPAAPVKRSILTRSAKEAALRNYKIYTPKLKASSSMQPRVCVEEETPVFVPRRSTRVCRKLNYQSAFDENDDSSISSTNSETVVEQHTVKYSCPYYSGDEEDQDQDQNVYCDQEVYDAANTLSSLNSCDEKYAYETTERCINPVTPCVRYAYRFKATCPDRKQHYMSSYVIYDERTRRYHLLNKHTLLAPDQSSPYAVNGYIESSFQTKYVSYLRDTVEKYIMNVLVHRSIPHVVTCEFIGLVMNDADYQRLFDVDSCFYDIDRIFTIQNSRQTTSGHEMFILTPEACYSETTFDGLHVQDALAILAGQH